MKDNSSAIVTDGSTQGNTKDIVIKYKPSSTAKNEYTVTVEIATGKIK